MPPVQMKTGSFLGCIVFGKLLRVEERSYQGKMESGKRTRSGIQSNPDWPVYMKFDRIEAGMTQGHTCPQKLLQLRGHTFLGRRYRMNRYQFFPDKFLADTGRIRLVSLHRLTLFDYRWSSRR